jgi:hypothetical protein
MIWQPFPSRGVICIQFSAPRVVGLLNYCLKFRRCSASSRKVTAARKIETTFRKIQTYKRRYVVGSKVTSRVGEPFLTQSFVVYLSPKQISGYQLKIGPSSLLRSSESPFKIPAPFNQRYTNHSNETESLNNLRMGQITINCGLQITMA